MEVSKSKAYFECPSKRCIHKFLRSKELKDHAFSAHEVELDENQLTASCPSCGKQYRHIRSCNRHLRTCVGSLPIETSQDTLQDVEDTATVSVLMDEVESLRMQVKTMKQELKSLSRKLEAETFNNAKHTNKLQLQLKRERIRIWVLQQQK